MGRYNGGLSPNTPNSCIVGKLIFEVFGVRGIPEILGIPEIPVILGTLRIFGILGELFDF